MLTILRHFLSILLLPFLVVVVVPQWLLDAFFANDIGWNPQSPIVRVAWIIAAACIVTGILLFGWCVSLFIRVGQGTLAPWDPTRNLVAIGPYRYVRNPMISAVALLLIGQALFWGSWSISLWACIFIIINHIYFVFFEEQGLEKRFGEPYRLYKASIPRWLPRIKPWSGK
jgi:protein-S-isoprenylcysteine O-methyltransferase Ste14